jgi:polyphosphate kinase
MLLAAISEETEAGPSGRIILKTNGLTDPGVIDALYRASQAGVPVDLVVRGRCSLRPGVPGLSEGIRVRSIVGRYLEHSRIFRFGGVFGRPLSIAIGSPDMMERNLDRRVEVIVPIDHPDIQQRLVGVLDDALRDEANSWTLGPDGRWTRVVAAGADDRGFSLQDQCQRLALASLRDQAGTIPTGSSPRTPAPPVGPSRRWWRRWRSRSG